MDFVYVEGLGGLGIISRLPVSSAEPEIQVVLKRERVHNVVFSHAQHIEMLACTLKTVCCGHVSSHWFL